MPKTLVIENVWCLECNHFFFVEHSEDHHYKCENCHSKISFELENMRYVVDK